MLPDRIRSLLPTYTDVIERLDKIEGVELKSYPCHGKEIPLVKAGDSPSVLFVGGMHGDEPSGVEACMRFLENEDFGSFSCLLFPMANPHGLEHNSRGSFSGADISWEFLTGKEPEILAIKDALQRYDPALVLDLHNTNFIMGRAAKPSGYLLAADDADSIRAGLYIRRYLSGRGLGDMLRKDMLPDYFIDPEEGKHAHYRKEGDGVFVKERHETGFKRYTSSLGIPQVCVESPAKTRESFFTEEGNIEAYERAYDRCVELHHTSMLAAVDYLKEEGESGHN